MAKNLNLGNFLTMSRCNIWKIGSLKLNIIFSTNFRSKTDKIVRAVFEKNIKVSDFRLIWRPFREYFQIKFFFKNPALSLFYLYSSLTSCKKSEKSLEPFLRKLRYQPTNQLLPTTPILYRGPGSRWSKYKS